MLLEINLPKITSESKSENFEPISLKLINFEPVGKEYINYYIKQNQTSNLNESSSSEGEEEEVDDEFDEEDEKLLKSLDPKEWKKQDHYKVLGLSKLRYRASEDQIKRAYKKKVLLYHPDKRGSTRGHGEGEDDYFTCITRAYEVLGVKSKRRSYDSVDPTFDNHIPPNNKNNKNLFFSVFGPVFERNKRWSIKKGVPSLGDENSSFDDVNNFYDFWYNFESWREFSYLEEEDKEKGENRDERRWIERQNKASRIKLKKEEMQRIRQLVDNAYNNDPRIEKFKKEEKEKKSKNKKLKEEAIKNKIQQKEKEKQMIEEANKLKKQKEEEELQKQLAAQRKEKENQKKIQKKEKKQLKNTMKELNYLVEGKEEERTTKMEIFDQFLDFASIDTITDLNKISIEENKEIFKQLYQKKIEEMINKKEEEKQKYLQQQIQQQQQQQNNNKGTTKSQNKKWEEQEVQLLIKAVNLFPAGTNARWDTISNFIKLHIPTSGKSSKDALEKAKQLQKNDLNLKEEANKKAFEKFSQQNKNSFVSVNVSNVSERYETPAEVQVYDVGSNPAPWTSDEQKLLEQAMRTYPSSLSDRWEKIAECIKTRTKKDCMKRYKELVELVRTKKLASASTNKLK